jgi:hypothetical protein
MCICGSSQLWEFTPYFWKSARIMYRPASFIAAPDFVRSDAARAIIRMDQDPPPRLSYFDATCEPDRAMP